MNLFSIFNVLLLSFYTSAQLFAFQTTTEKLLANPDITWAGEVYVDYLPNITIQEPVDAQIKELYGTSEYNVFEILKIQTSPLEDWLQPTSHLLSNHFLQLTSKHLNAYADANLTQKLSPKAYSKAAAYQVVDTVLAFDPETYVEMVKIDTNELRPQEVQTFRVKQLLTYNESQNQLQITPIAIAPVATIYNKSSLRRNVRKDVLFWIPVKEAFKALNLETTTITWAKRLKKDVSSETINTIKGTGSIADVFDKMVAHYKTQPSSTKMYAAKEKQLTLLSPDAVKNFGDAVDTVVTFDPNTFEERIDVVHRNLPQNFATKVRLIQDWYWNAQTQEMQIRTLGFAPISSQTDAKTKHAPMYYIKTKE